MNTICTIGIEKNNLYNYIICYQDGWPEYTGYLLKSYYSWLSEVYDLLDKGDVVNLEKDIKDIIYLSDEGEKYTEVKTIRMKDLPLIAEKVNFIYIYSLEDEEPKWRCYSIIDSDKLEEVDIFEG